MTKEAFSTERALKQALEALELCNGAKTVEGVVIYTGKEITAIKEALSSEATATQPAQDGKCKYCTDGCHACDARKLPEPEQEPVTGLDVYLDSADMKPKRYSAAQPAYRAVKTYHEGKPWYVAQPEQEDGCPVCGSDVHDRDALDKAEREIERLTALVKPAPVLKPLSKKWKWVLHESFADVAGFDEEGIPSFYWKESVTKFKSGELSVPCKGKNCGSLNGWLHSDECRAEHEAQYTTPPAVQPEKAKNETIKD